MTAFKIYEQQLVIINKATNLVRKKNKRWKFTSVLKKKIVLQIKVKLKGGKRDAFVRVYVCVAFGKLDWGLCCDIWIQRSSLYKLTESQTFEESVWNWSWTKSAQCASIHHFLHREAVTQDTPVIFDPSLVGKHTAWHGNLHSTVQNRQESGFDRDSSLQKTNYFLR